MLGPLSAPPRRPPRSCRLPDLSRLSRPCCPSCWRPCCQPSSRWPPSIIVIQRALDSSSRARWSVGILSRATGRRPPAVVPFPRGAETPGPDGRDSLPDGGTTSLADGTPYRRRWDRLAHVVGLHAGTPGTCRAARHQTSGKTRARKTQVPTTNPPTRHQTTHTHPTSSKSSSGAASRPRTTTSTMSFAPSSTSATRTSRRYPSRW